jgi:hypothetical protein
MMLNVSALAIAALKQMARIRYLMVELVLAIRRAIVISLNQESSLVVVIYSASTPLQAVEAAESSTVEIVARVKQFLGQTM